MPKVSAPPLTTLFQTALALIAQDGLSALTLRALAQRAGIGVSSITHLTGNKSQLIDLLIKRAMECDADLQAGFSDWIKASSALNAQELTEGIDLVFETYAVKAPDLVVFFSELVLASATDPELSQMLHPWRTAQAEFWSKIAALSAHPKAAQLPDMLLGFFVDEITYTPALECLLAYRRLRRLCLHTLLSFDFLPADPRRSSPLFDRLVAELGAIDDPLSFDKGQGFANDPKRDTYAYAASQIMVHEGLGTITHRSVAQRAGVAPSTLAYHFKTQDDLVSGAMVNIIRRLKETVAQGDGPTGSDTSAISGYEIGRSTQMLALQARRKPLYLGTAADMRRKRGINLTRKLNAGRPEGQGLNELQAQTLSILALGTLMLHAGHGLDVAQARAGRITSLLLSPV